MFLFSRKSRAGPREGAVHRAVRGQHEDGIGGRAQAGASEQCAMVGLLRMVGRSSYQGAGMAH